jgi:hypothetical protein
MPLCPWVSGFRCFVVKDQGVQEEQLLFMDSLTLEDEGTGFFQNVGNHWPSNIVSHSRRPESLSFSFILKVFVYYVVTMLVIRM